MNLFSSFSSISTFSMTTNDEDDVLPPNVYSYQWNCTQCSLPLSCEVTATNTARFVWPTRGLSDNRFCVSVADTSRSTPDDDRGTNI